MSGALLFIMILNVPIRLMIERKNLNDLNYRAKGQEIIKRAVLLINGKQKDTCHNQIGQLMGRKDTGMVQQAVFSKI